MKNFGEEGTKDFHPGGCFVYTQPQRPQPSGVREPV